ncbi:MAG: hypothetical protein HY532_09575 [Chloroflexi bacterium]|nr:hypothetical protein [Chloroflexota bacterium]
MTAKINTRYYRFLPQKKQGKWYSDSKTLCNSWHKLLRNKYEAVNDEWWVHEALHSGILAIAAHDAGWTSFPEFPIQRRKRRGEEQGSERGGREDLFLTRVSGSEEECWDIETKKVYVSLSSEQEHWDDTIKKGIIDARSSIQTVPPHGDHCTAIVFAVLFTQKQPQPSDSYPSFQKYLSELVGNKADFAAIHWFPEPFRKEKDWQLGIALLGKNMKM